ncbi:MAG: endonuclease domain-containing protein [Proteobacteria bacterium]|nr:endonuclease domain-containing protein [Pseudomonadota bacterium]MBS0465581.1 endonuclease domain-containing protein [Pseudomonadota bacterium]
MSGFQRDAIGEFHFVRCAFDADSGVARLVYAFDAGDELTETVTIPGAPFALDHERAAQVERALRLLHLIAGVSYYKAAVPPRIVIDGYAIDADTARLLESIYENGLGEFAYRNGLDLRGRIAFPALLRAPSGRWVEDEGLDSIDTSPAGAPPPQPSPAGGGGSVCLLPPLTPGEESRAGSTSAHDTECPPAVAVDRVGRDWGARSAASLPTEIKRARTGLLPPLAGEGWDGGKHKALVAIGGGKDSLVSIESLRAMGVDQTVAWIGSSPLIAACAARTGLPTLNIQRQLASALFEYNRHGAYNGHIPVTAINSAILVLAAVLRGFDQVVFSNERSASYGSQILGDDGRVLAQVNHQWSKGWAFERDFGAHVHAHIADDVHYYSLLRPLSELAVARQFARSDRYDAHFSSCNRNFHILGERPANRWCGQCPKCHFVFLALAPFVPKPRLVGIFGRNLLDESALAPGFDALIEYRDHKPFECVGEGREARAAFAALAQRPAWREDALVKRFVREIAAQLHDVPPLDALLAPQGEQRIPEALWERLDAYWRT